MGLFSAETRQRLNGEDRGWAFKLGLRYFATLLAVPALVLFAASTALSVNNYGGDDWVDAMPLAPVLLALLYNPIHTLLTVHPTLHRPIHPAWPLTIDLLIWGLALPGLVFSVGDGWFWVWQPVELSVDGDYILCEFAANFWSEPCNPMIYTLGRMEIAANVFLALILIAHFILFIYSCIAAHRHRLSRARSAHERRNIELQYHRDPESHRASAPPQYTPSNVQPSSRHQLSSSISKSFVGGNSNEDGINTGLDHEGKRISDPRHEAESPTPYKSLEAGQSPPLRNTGDEWTRTSDQPPRLGSPVSPINSGSGGGFMDGSEFEGVVLGGVSQYHRHQEGQGEEEGPFADRHAVRYA